MGQGIRSSLAAVLADEMEADWKRVTLRQADADATSSARLPVSRPAGHRHAPISRTDSKTLKPKPQSSSPTRGRSVHRQLAQHGRVLHADAALRRRPAAGDDPAAAKKWGVEERGATRRSTTSSQAQRPRPSTTSGCCSARQKVTPPYDRHLQGAQEARGVELHRQREDEPSRSRRRRRHGHGQAEYGARRPSPRHAHGHDRALPGRQRRRRSPTTPPRRLKVPGVVKVCSDPHLRQSPRAGWRRHRLHAARRRGRAGGEHLGRVAGPPQAQADHQVGPRALRRRTMPIRLDGLSPRARGVDRPSRGSLCADREDVDDAFAQAGRARRGAATTFRTWPRPRWSRPWPSPFSRRGRHLEVWAPTQNPDMAQQMAGMVALGLSDDQMADETFKRRRSRENVTVHMTLLGGGFGRKSKPDYIVGGGVSRQAQIPACRSACSGRARTTSNSATTTRPAIST